MVLSDEDIFVQILHCDLIKKKRVKNCLNGMLTLASDSQAYFIAHDIFGVYFTYI